MFFLSGAALFYRVVRVRSLTLFFVGLTNLYPSIYIPPCPERDNAPLYLSLIRILFSLVALIISMTLKVNAAISSSYCKLNIDRSEMRKLILQ